MLGSFYKKNESDKVWWVNEIGTKGKHLFSFDKITVFNLFQDYPYKLTPDQKSVFDNENPEWAEFFKGRSKNG